MRGIQIRYRWSEIEISKGVYDFTAIDQRLSELGAIGKRLVILFDTKSYDPDDDIVPGYLKTAEYDGGQFTYSAFGSTEPKGNCIAMYDRNVINRLQQLIDEFSQKYDNEAYFEAFGFTESSTGELLPEDQSNDYYNNLLGLDVYASRAFARTMTYQNMNYPRTILQKFTDVFAVNGISLAGPDVFIEDPGLNMKDNPNTPDGVYAHYERLSGIVPLAPSVQAINYINTKHDGSGYDPTVQQLLNFARNSLHANYIFWTRDPAHYQEVLSVLNEPAQTADPVGGLISTPPATYSTFVC